MYNTSDDRFLFNVLGLVVNAPRQRGFAFIKPLKKIIQPCQVVEYIDFSNTDMFEIDSDIFSRYEHIISKEDHKEFNVSELYTFGINRGKKGLYAVNLVKVGNIYDENGYIRNLEEYGIYNIQDTINNL